MGKFRSEITWTIRTIRSGQPRAYADTEHVGEIELDGDWYGKRPDFGREVVKRALSGLSNFGTVKEKDEDRYWYEPYLDYLEKVAPSLWKFRIVRPYDD